jgi:methylthioribose-1-phosphate isomerase
MQSLPITTKVVSLNPVHGEVYSIQHYVIKFASDLLQVGGFSLGTPVSSTDKTDRHDITEILLKVALNTIIQTKPSSKNKRRKQD